MTNEKLYDKAVEAIEDLFSDTSVSRGECRTNLNALIDEIAMKLDALEVDDETDLSLIEITE